jgi:hypothetical protein
MSTLLPYHKTILEKIHDPATSDLLILARGLGLRRIITTLMKIYDSPQNLVLLINATPEEESAIGEELGIMGCRKPGLRVISYETKDRCVLSYVSLLDYLNGSFLQTGLVQAGRHNFRHFAYISCGHVTIGYSDRTDYWIASLARRKVNNMLEYHIYGFTSFLYIESLHWF